MGLDMYAFTIKKELLNDDQVTDVPVGKLSRRAVGFLDLTDADLEKMPEANRKVYWDQRSEADLRAKNEGFFDGDFAYWRKFNHLHGWMEQLYRAKGGTDEQFNCNNVRINAEDFDRLESMATMKALAPTRGFFFGGNEPFSNEDRDEVLEFIKRSREAMANGMVVFYDSWW
jgi:hypothetical protein